ncbi:type VI secretion system membrane subunit TssM [Sphingomonas radiodurans]|uniref:type VI secretion system membrane subunit TssM n=1 Tax=Sphingomonas radiodurans TaxID=2890321 RepID=UPI001E3DEB21|nr:type VI secretion system membrane subunit TssM [Sphingomonas radiodurans]WBH16689.1 type VI secretion system membrane subunit TssM [Sphingomonas radiodurans]
MKALFRNRWFWRVLGALLAGLVLWFVGPLIAIAGWRPLGWWPVTLFVALLPIIGVGIFWWWARRRDQRANAAMMDALKPEASAADHDEISGKLGDALDMLKSAKLGARGSYAYQLPWYAIIGPSGAGKTTALLNSGLNFPTAVAGEYRSLRGQPNTPNCDWWFTDEAVLIDTAGRYVTQDVTPQDGEGWKSFLELLKKYRPLQPLNGVIVAIPAPDFADAAKMSGHANNIRARLAELQGTLGQDLPVYVLVTKADLLAGFREYFGRSTDAESDQVFGSTAPGTGSDNDAVLKGFDDLVASISSRVVDRMQTEGQLPLRGQIAAFPAQLASLRAPLATLLAALGQKSRFDQPARVRGVYLASGTQTGNPVDRILMSVGGQATASAHAVGQGRSYFLRRFFSDLIIPEQGMAGRNALSEKRAQQRYVASIVAAAAALVVAVGVWTWGYFRNSALIDRVYTTTSAYAQAAGESRGGSASVEQDLAALGVLGTATDEMAAAGDFALGLGQGGRLEGELRGIYGRDLQRRLVPVLVGLAEERMAADTNAPSALYDDLKSYLILGGRGPSMSEQLLAWVQPAWIARGGANAETEAGDLAKHTAALFPDAFKPVGIDDQRVEAARAVLRVQPAAVRVYGRLKSEALKAEQPMWSARENAGPRPELFFAGGGAFAPGAGVPALFTRTGYDKIFLPIVARGPELLAEENWVVGDNGGAKLTPTEMGALKQDLERLYFGEVLQRWTDYLAAVQLRPASNLAENVQRLRDGGGPLSPIAPLMRAIAKATDFTPNKALPKPSGALAGMMGAAGMGPDAAGPRANVANAFLPLRMFVGDGKSPAPVDAMLQSMTALADKLNTIAVLPGGGGESGSMQSTEAKALIMQLDQNANAMPAPAQAVAKGVASDASVALGGARLAQMEGALNASFGDQCAQSLSRAFPIAPAATADLPVETFTRFFSPQGQFASFVSKELAGYVDTVGPQWQAKENAGEIGLTESNVRALQAANLVTRTFFAADPNGARLSYQIEPIALSGATSVTLQVDGQKLSYDGKSPIPATFEWPGAGGASIEFAGAGGSVPITRAWTGPWAVFRLMKVSAIKAGASPAIGEGSLTQAGARFDFRVRTFTSVNPFVVDPFVKIACPSSQVAAAAA